MKDIPVIRSKLIMPQLPPAMSMSERLQGLCNEMHERHTVIITAPAGYGKTTLMVAALNGYRSGDSRICWYRLDEEDRDLAVFYTHLVETLFPEEEQAWEGARAGLANGGDIFTQHQYLNALICQELWTWHNRRPEVKTFIVFDDFHRVLDTPEITGAIQFFIENLPENCAMIVSSRWETGLLTGKRRLERNILEITRSDLYLSEEELASLIRERSGIIPEQGLLQKIMLHTEGWLAGIILVCQMLRLNGSDQASGFLSRSGEKEPLFQYLAAEVLKTVDDRLLHFLIKAALLHEFTAAEAGEIFEESNASELIELCEQKGLFIQKISGMATTYRFHSLFRELLQQIQHQRLSPEEVNDYHLKAAAYYIEHHNFNRAIEHFVLCGSVDQAVALIMRESARLIAFEAADQFRLWIRLLPESVVSASGHLLFIKSFIYFQRDLGYTLQLLEQALAIFQQTDDLAMQFHTVTQIASVYTLRNDVLGIRRSHTVAMELSGRLQGLPLADNLAVFDRTVVTVWEEKYLKVAEYPRHFASLALDVEWEYVVYFYSAFAYWQLGDLGPAESQIQAGLNLDFVKQAKLFKSYCQILYSSILQMKDELDAFSRQINDLLEIAEKYNYKYILAFGKRLAAIDSYRRNDLEGALEQIDASTRFWEEIGNQAMANSNKLYRCLWLCGQEHPKLPTGTGPRRNNPPKLLAEARKALKALTATPSGMCLQEIGLSVFGAIASEAWDYKLAEKSLLSAVKRSKAKGAKQVLCGSLLHLAKLYYDSGDQTRGEDYLRQAFDLAVDNKYTMFWDLHFPTLVEMAVRCIKNNIHAGYARALIARYYGEEAAGFMSDNTLLTADECLKDFSDAFMSRYGTKDKMQSPQININLFGKFNITVGGMPIPDHEWKTKKIAGILKYLLVNRGRPVSREQLMNLFWPEVDRKLALHSLRAALYELRKVLRQYDVPLEGKASLLYEKRDSLEVRSESLVTVDVDSFLTYFSELKKLSTNRGDKNRKKIILEKMITLYQGDFLEKDVYEDWVFAEREELKSIYLGSVIELANIYISDGDNRKAEKVLLSALAIDQFNEEACLCLLKLYVSSNQRSRAAKLCSNFVKRFEKELGIKPDERITSIVR